VGLRVADVDGEKHQTEEYARAVPTTLYAVPASHPCATVERALRHKALPYRRVDLIPMTHPPMMLARFGGRTVPAVRFEDGETAQGSRAIIRALERRVPDPPLLPDHPDGERAEEWGEQVLQPLVRRVIWAALRRAPGASASYTLGANLPVRLPAPVQRAMVPLVSRLESALNRATDANVRADLVSLPAHLRRVEDWLDEGALGGARLSAADLQVAAGLRLLTTIEDLAGALDRPAGAYARRAFPDYPGRVPAGTLPDAWLRER
jgi:glutathione S-transferase